MSSTTTNREILSTPAARARWARAAMLVAPLVAACGTPCEVQTRSVELARFCNTPGACQLPADLVAPRPSQMQIGGGQAVVVPVAAALSGLSANPQLWGSLFFWGGAASPGGGGAALDPSAVQVTFDGAPVDCDVKPTDSFEWTFGCTVPAGVQSIALAYSGDTPAVTCETAADCCQPFVEGDPPEAAHPGVPAYCACNDGLCAFPIVVDDFYVSESTPSGPCLSSPADG